MRTDPTAKPPDAPASALPFVAIDASAYVPPRPLPPPRYVFPDAREAPPDAPAARGGDLAPETIVAAARAGLFAWPHGGVDALWWSPDPRAILRPARLRVPRRLARRLRRGRFRVTVDADFARVVAGCAERPEGTWITPALTRAWLRLHALGRAHSFETRDETGALTGGLYGLRAGGLFQAESMFHRAPDASKIALLALCRHALAEGVSLIDAQLPAPHLAALGAETVSRERYLRLLADALAGRDPAFAPKG